MSVITRAVKKSFFNFLSYIRSFPLSVFRSIIQKISHDIFLLYKIQCNIFHSMEYNLIIQENIEVLALKVREMILELM